jgi:hypothetical protein
MSTTSLPEYEGAEQPRSAASDLKQTAVEATATISEEIREGVRHGTARAREEAAARTEDAKQGLAREVSTTAEALDAASRELQENSLQRSLLSEASKGLASMSQALQGRSVDELVADVAEFGRRNPAAFLGGAALAGFAVARLATASAPAARLRQHDADAASGTGKALNRAEKRPRSEEAAHDPTGFASTQRTEKEASNERHRRTLCPGTGG